MAAAPAPVPTAAAIPGDGGSGLGRAIELTAKSATSWVGLLTAYAVAVTAAVFAVIKLKDSFGPTRLWLWIALVSLPVVAAFVFQTIPAMRAQRRRKWLISFDKPPLPGYFSLAPREDEETFKRADGKHDEVLRWLQQRPAPVMYLTGLSGTGKSSVLSAWVLPKLQREGTRVICLRGYQDLVATLDKELRTPGVIWERLAPDAGDVRSLLEKACAYLHPNRLLVVIDQFEEFVILQDRPMQEGFEQLANSLQAEPIPDFTLLLVSRSDYNGLIEDRLPRLNQATNWKEVPPFLATAAGEFLRGSTLPLNDEMLNGVLREAAEIERTKGIIRPVTINLCGLVLGRFAGGLPRGFRPGELIRGFLTESITMPSIREVAPRLIPHLITKSVTKRPRSVAELAELTALEPGAVRGCLRVLGQEDKGIVRPLDGEQQTWEISHDFLVPSLDSIVTRWTVSLWRRVRDWVPWVAAAVLAVGVIAISSYRRDPIVELANLGWQVHRSDKGLELSYKGLPPKGSVRLLGKFKEPLIVRLSEIDSSLSEWRSLANLTSLDLDYAKVSDLSPLQGLTSLTSLSFASTKVSDLSPLKGLTNLTSLRLPGTNVSDLSPLKALTNLTSLELHDTEVSDLSPLQGLTSLTSLSFASTKVSDLSPLKGLTNLTSLVLFLTRVTDLSPLKGLTNLTSLALFQTRVSDLSPLQGLTNLKLLNLRVTKVSDLSPLKGLTNLTSISLESAPVSNVSPLKGLTNLKLLNLSGAPVSDVSPLKELANLNSLYLNHTQVSDVSPLKGLTNLTELNLTGTQVSDVSPLKGLTNLTELDLSSTKVSDVSSLKGLTNLTELNLTGTKVSDVSPLKNLKNLRIRR